MNLFWVEVEQTFLLNENNFGWSWNKMRIVEYIYLVEYKHKMLNINVQVVEFCNIWLTMEMSHTTLRQSDFTRTCWFSQEEVLV